MDKVVVGRCGGMKRQIYDELKALEHSMLARWRDEMVKAGLFGPTYSGKLVQGNILSPIEFDTS